MRIATFIVFATGMLAAADARADRRNCEVDFVRVPDDVRLVIEKWLAAEPRCTGTIALRVVATEKGTLYLVAQRPDGRIHEREVPDAQSAGVLVASWVADDWTSERSPEPDAAPPPRMAPGEAPSVIAVLPPAPRAAKSEKWATLGLLLGDNPEQNGGFHLDIDLIQRGAWTFGVSGEYAERVNGNMNDVWLHASDWRLLVKVARTFRLSDRATLAATFGLGLVHTETTVVTMSYDPDNIYQDVPGETAVADVGATISRELGDSWAVTAGPKLTLQEQEHDLWDGTYVKRAPVDFAMLFGIRYRL